jgi:MEMO1 family protein
MNVRKAILAGSWYPARPEACKREIETYLEEIDFHKDPEKRYQGGIVPHAGWYYSGNIACNVIRALQDDPPPDVLLVFGMHLHPRSPNFIMTQGAWETPFGEIPIESRLAGELDRQFEFVIETDQQYTQDNTIEVQLPFIKYFFGDAALVPIGVPPIVESLEIAHAAVSIARRLGLKIKVIGSTDLTHYGSNYGFSPKGRGSGALNWVTQENDMAVIRAMRAMDPLDVLREGMNHQNACCSGAAASAIAAVKQLGAKSAEVIRYATSHDKSPGESFVGYVGMVFG